MSPLHAIRPLNQSLWLDFIRRNMIVNGELKRRIEHEALRGVTSNPAIFEKAINGSDDYDAAIRSLALLGKSTPEIYEALAVADVQQACDLFRSLYDSPDAGGDGYVSLEVSPELIYDTEGTIEEGIRLWKAVDRPNVMIKVPATLEGLPAIRRLIAEGINVNVTLIFGLERYRQVAEAFMAGLEDRVARGLPLQRIDSVASFFLSRIDVLIDPMLEQKAAEGASEALALQGEVAVSSAKLAYQIYKELFAGDRFRALEVQGAEKQRLLWASTGNKNPRYDDLKYVELLIGPETVNTVPTETLDIFRERGTAALHLEDDLENAKACLAALPGLGLDLNALTQHLETDGGKKFIEPFAKLMAALEAQRQKALAEEINQATLQADVNAQEKAFELQALSERFWKEEAAFEEVWPGADTHLPGAKAWLLAPDAMIDRVPLIEQFVHDVKADGFTHVVLLGMGDSTVVPNVLTHAFTQPEGGLPLFILDTRDLTKVRRVEQVLPLQTTLFVVSHKSGVTAEPLAYSDYFYAKVKELKGDRAGENFVAIADSGTSFEEAARRQGYRYHFPNFPEIEGRYSALCGFGLLPAALYGLNIGELLERGIRMKRACGAYGPVEENPAQSLASTLLALAEQGRTTLTLMVPPHLSQFGRWVRKLVAASNLRNHISVTEEPLLNSHLYGNDRVFVHVAELRQPDEPLLQKVGELRGAGHPTLSFSIAEPMDIGQEFLRWEIAVALAETAVLQNPKLYALT